MLEMVRCGLQILRLDEARSYLILLSTDVAEHEVFWSGIYFQILNVKCDCLEMKD